MDFQAGLGQSDQFKDVIISAAEARKTQIIADAQRESQRKLHAAQGTCDLADRERVAAACVQDAERRYSAAVEAARTELLALRSELVGEVFAEIEQQLLGFTTTPAYRDWLAGKLKARRGEAKQTNEAPVVWLRPADKAIAGVLQKILPGSVMETDEGIWLGGFKLRLGRLLYDETFDMALKDERERFYTESGLHV